jgi:hypothetical protein
MGSHINFSQDHIEYDPTVYKEVSIEVIQQFNNYEGVFVKVVIGGFTLRLKILNIMG